MADSSRPTVRARHRRGPTSAGGRALTQEPNGSTLRVVLRREESRRGSDAGRAIPPEARGRPCLGRQPKAARQRCHRPPAGAAQLHTCRSASDPRSPCQGGRGVVGGSGTGRAQRCRCLPLCPCGGRIWKARRSVCSSALPRRRGVGTWPGAQPCTGPSSGAVSAAAQTGPRAAAQAGSTFATRQLATVLRQQRSVLERLPSGSDPHTVENREQMGRRTATVGRTWGACMRGKQAVARLGAWRPHTIVGVESTTRPRLQATEHRGCRFGERRGDSSARAITPCVPDAAAKATGTHRYFRSCGPTALALKCRLHVLCAASVAWLC
jgi:hypothetical protein